MEDENMDLKQKYEEAKKKMLNLDINEFRKVINNPNIHYFDKYYIYIDRYQNK